MAWFKKNFPPKIRLRFLILIIALLVILFFFWRWPRSFSLVKVGDCLLKAEVVDTPASQYQGLSDRAELCPDCAMLFVFAEAKPRTFVMRRMNFPIDIIFIANQTVLNIHHQAEPEGAIYYNKYTSLAPADAVLEVNAGLAARCNLQSGDFVSFSH